MRTDFCRQSRWNAESHAVYFDRTSECDEGPGSEIPEFIDDTMMSPDEKHIIRSSFERHFEVARKAMEQLTDPISEAGKILVECLTAGRKVLICGNGGSAADAQHFAAELTGRFVRERRGLPAIALSSDSSALTAIGNDYGFDRVFSRQVEALAQSGDVLVAISTSGKSPNVIQAVAAAHKGGCRTIALSGGGGGELARKADRAIVVPSDETAVIQELHIVIIHLLCELIDKQFARD